MDSRVDWDDKKIMSLTSMENGANDTFRLKITMPLSKRVVTSEWVRMDKRREALFAWCASIKAQADVDVADFEQSRKEQVLAERAKQSPLVGVDGAALSATQPMAATGIPTSAVAPTSAPAPAAYSPSTLMSNPDDYIADQLKRALIREAESADALRAAQRAHEDAVASLAKWQKLNEALGAK